MKLTGLHHLTAICGDPKANVAFFTKILGLRMIKQTVNFDDPGTWHLYYGDAVGTPGTVLTFFPFQGIGPRHPGWGESAAYSLSIPSGSKGFWEERLSALDQPWEKLDNLWGESGLVVKDPDGFPVALVEDPEPLVVEPWTSPEISAEVAIRGFRGVTLEVQEIAPSAHMLTGLLGARVLSSVDGWQRIALGEGPNETLIDLRADPSSGPGRAGLGSVHHIAWGIKNQDEQIAALKELRENRVLSSEVRNRNYFHSIYFREPGGILYEIATEGPGFAIDEPLEKLGTTLKLPEEYEPYRERIIAHLPALV